MNCHRYILVKRDKDSTTSAGAIFPSENPVHCARHDKVRRHFFYKKLKVEMERNSVILKSVMSQSASQSNAFFSGPKNSIVSSKLFLSLLELRKTVTCQYLCLSFLFAILLLVAVFLENFISDTLT